MLYMHLCFVKDDQHDMEVDTATQATVKHSPELEIYCYLLVLIFLIDEKKYSEVSMNGFSHFVIACF